MGKHQLTIRTATAAFVTSAIIISGAAAAQQTTTDQSAQQADYVPGQFGATEGQVVLDLFNRELTAMEAARSANNCDAWESHSKKATMRLNHLFRDGNLSNDVINQLKSQFAAARAKGCQTLNEEQAAEGLGVVSVIDVATTPGVDLDFEVDQIKDLVNRCRNNDGSQTEFLNSQKDRYRRHYREVEAAMNEYRELALTEDDPAKAQSYSDNARKYESALEGMPKPRDFPCRKPIIDAGDGGFRYVRIGAALDSAEGFSTGMGFAREGAPGTAPETFATQTPNRIDSVAVAAALVFPDYKFDGFYREGDASASSSIAAGGGVDAGLVYGELSPSGSSGIAAPFGLDSAVKANLKSWGVGASYELYSAEGGSRTDTFSADSMRNRMMLQSVGVTIGYQRTEREYSGTASASGTQGGFTFEYNQTRDQKISEDQFHLGAEALMGMSFSERVAVSSRIRVGGYYRDTSLESVEVNQNNFTGAPDGMFTVTIQRDDNGLGFQGGADLFIDFNLSPGPRPGPALSIGGGVEYQSTTGGIFNPNSGDQVFFDGLTTDLITGDTLRWFAGVGITFPL